MLYPVTLFSSEPIFILQVLLAISEPVINLTTLHVCWHPCGPLPCVITRTTSGLPASLLAPPQNRVTLPNGTSDYVTLQIKSSRSFL